MSNLYLRLKNLPFYLSPAFIFAAGTLIVVNILNLIPSDKLNILYDGIHSLVSSLFAFAASTFIIYFICKNTRKAIAAGYSVMLFDAVLYVLCAVHISFVFVIILSLSFSFFFEKYSLIYAFSVCCLISIVAGLALGLSYDYLFSFLKSLCSSLKGKGAVFGMVNNVYSLVFSENLEKLFFHKDYSGTAYINSQVVTGVVDIFNAQSVAGVNVSKYLSGKYFVNIFISIGLLLLLYNKLEKEQKTAFTLSFVLALVFGDVRLISLFLLVYNPIMYLGYLGVIFISYFLAYLLDIRIVFLDSGSLFELIRYIDKPVYFILSGLVIAVLTYFLESLIVSKFDFHGRRIFPREVRKLVNSLGGERNIEKIAGNSVILRNPNLINILAVDCEIKGNCATLYPDDLSVLKPYFD